MHCRLVASGWTGPGPRRRGAELISARSARRESRLRPSARLGQPWASEPARTRQVRLHDSGWLGASSLSAIHRLGVTVLGCQRFRASDTDHVRTMLESQIVGLTTHSCFVPLLLHKLAKLPRNSHAAPRKSPFCACCAVSAMPKPALRQ